MELDIDMSSRGSAPLSSIQVGRRDSAALLRQVQPSPVTLLLAHVYHIQCGFDVNVLKKEKYREKLFNFKQNFVSLVILLSWGGMLPFLIRMKSKTARSL